MGTLAGPLLGRSAELSSIDGALDQLRRTLAPLVADG